MTQEEINEEEIRQEINTLLSKGLWSWENNETISLDGTCYYLIVKKGLK